MRAFNPREKEIIKRIVALNSAQLHTCNSFFKANFFTDERGMALIMDHNRRKASLFVKANSSDTGDISAVFDKTPLLMELLVLLQYLRDNRYLAIIPFENYIVTVETFYEDFDYTRYDPDRERLILSSSGTYLPIDQGLIRNSSDEVIFKGLDLSDFYKLLYQNLVGFIIPSAELEELVKNKFKSKEEKHHSQLLIVSWTGIIVAVLLGILGLVNASGKNFLFVFLIKGVVIKHFLDWLPDI